MIQKQNKRLFKYYFLLVATLGLPLVGFFFYATKFQFRFFTFLVFALLFNVLILTAFYRRMKRKRSLVKVQREEYFEQSNLIKEELRQQKAAIGAFRQKIVTSSQLKTFAEIVSSCLSLGDTMKVLAHEVSAMFSSDGNTVTLYLFDQQTGDLEVAHASCNLKSIQLKQRRGDVFDRWVIKTMQPLILEDATSDFRFDIDKVDEDAGRLVHSVMSVPLVVERKMLGILRLDHSESHQFTPEDLRFLKTIGDLAAVAIENAQLFDRIEYMAIRDGLTGLYLRRHLMGRLTDEIQRHLKRNEQMSFVMFDLDHFKKYNDKFGHTAGDIVLKRLAELMNQFFSDQGTVICRFGGEEFCVLLTKCDKNRAFELAAQFVKIVAGEPIILRREKTKMTISAGVAGFPEDAKTKEDFVKKADDALYEAKHKGRNRACAA